MRLNLRHLIVVALAGVTWISGPVRADYQVTNLVSDIAGLSAVTDTNLKNPWGVSFAPTGPFWVSDQATSKSTLYHGQGTPQALVVSMPTTTGGPTGQVFNGNGADFLLTNGKSASFLFANLNGQIQAWNGGSGTTSQIVTPASGSVYTGLAIGAVGSDNVLFAADARGNKVDVFNSTFQNLTSTTYAGAFVDPNLPTGYKVFNIQNLGGSLYVTYDDNSGGNAAINGGVVAVFGLDGHFIKQIIASGPGGPLEDPWGLVIAPSTFGQFANDLLVGNKESGQINAFDPNSGALLGRVATITNDPTSTNNGLWALTFGNGGSAGSVTTLYAFAGINNEQDGLIAAVNAVPEPGSMVLMGIGGTLAWVVARRRRRPASA